MRTLANSHRFDTPVRGDRCDLVGMLATRHVRRRSRCNRRLEAGLGSTSDFHIDADQRERLEPSVAPPAAHIAAPGRFATPTGVGGSMNLLWCSLSSEISAARIVQCNRVVTQTVEFKFDCIRYSSAYMQCKNH